MAQTITIATNLANATSGARFSAGVSRITAGDGVDHRFMTIGTDEEEVEISADVANKGWCWIKNCAAANYLQIGFATGDYKIRIPGGCSMLVCLEPGVSSLFMKSYDTTTDISFVVLEA